jgi:hypothetical protein
MILMVHIDQRQVVFLATNHATGAEIEHRNLTSRRGVIPPGSSVADLEARALDLKSNDLADANRPAPKHTRRPRLVRGNLLSDFEGQLISCCV